MTKRKSPEQIKRAGTMAETAKEGSEFTSDDPALKKSRTSEGPETRLRKNAREVVDELSAGPKDIPPEKLEAYQQKLKKAFILFDKKNEGFLDEKGIAAVFKSMKKRPLKAKIREIITEADKDHSGTISMEEFVNYMSGVAKEEPEQVQDLPEEVVDVAPAAAPVVERAPSFQALERGASFTMEESLAAGEIQIGMGWKSPFDLDVSVMVYDKNFQLKETVSYQKLVSVEYFIRHSGDILVGGADGDLEKIDIQLSKLPEDITILMFVVAIYSSGKYFTDVESAYARLVDSPSGGSERCKFTLDAEHFGKSTAMAMCKVFKTGGVWKMMTIGEPLIDEVRNPTSIVQSNLLTKYVYDDYVPPNAEIQAL